MSAIVSRVRVLLNLLGMRICQYTTRRQVANHKAIPSPVYKWELHRISSLTKVTVERMLLTKSNCSAAWVSVDVQRETVAMYPLSPSPDSPASNFSRISIRRVIPNIVAKCWSLNANKTFHCFHFNIHYCVHSTLLVLLSEQKATRAECTQTQLLLFVAISRIHCWVDSVIWWFIGGRFFGIPPAPFIQLWGMVVLLVTVFKL